MSNQKQLGIGAKTYLTDWDETYPMVNFPEPPGVIPTDDQPNSALQKYPEYR